ncbi:MAG: hypothetical protein N2747_00455 [Chitinophagaceae bacterium]|nr:hypothetical protein [Chitinophagaceae bacterium]
MDKHEEFLTAIEEYGFLSDINSQVCYLEKILNYKFDSVLKRIIITDDLSLEKKYFFLRPENKPHYLYLRTETGLPTYIYRRDEVSNLAPGFVVHVPNSLNNKEPLIKKIVQRYKLAGIKFKIKYV